MSDSRGRSFGKFSTGGSKRFNVTHSDLSRTSSEIFDPKLEDAFLDLENEMLSLNIDDSEEHKFGDKYDSSMNTMQASTYDQYSYHVASHAHKVKKNHVMVNFGIGANDACRNMKKKIELYKQETIKLTDKLKFVEEEERQEFSLGPNDETSWRKIRNNHFPRLDKLRLNRMPSPDMSSEEEETQHLTACCLSGLFRIDDENVTENA